MMVRGASRAVLMCWLCSKTWRGLLCAVFVSLHVILMLLCSCLMRGQPFSPTCWAVTQASVCMADAHTAAVVGASLAMQLKLVPWHTGLTVESETPVAFCAQAAGCGWVCCKRLLRALLLLQAAPTSRQTQGYLCLLLIG